MKPGDLVKIYPTYTESNKNGDRFQVCKSGIGIIMKEIKVKISATSYWRVYRSDGAIYDYQYESLSLIK